MDLLESTLRTVNAHGYLANFQREGLKANNLKILSDEDLQLLGISDEETRQKLLEVAQSLIYAKEKKVAVVIDHECLETIFANVYNQLQLYTATLTCRSLRQDCINCDIPLTIATNRIREILHDLNTIMINIHNQILNTKGLKSIKEKKSSSNCFFYKGILISLCMSGLYIGKRLLF